jgi:hypothetical protein
MTDREKLLKLYADLKAIELPIFDNNDLQIIVNTISEGIQIILGWLADAAKKYLTHTDKK